MYYIALCINLALPCQALLGAYMNERECWTAAGEEVRKIWAQRHVATFAMTCKPGLVVLVERGPSWSGPVSPPPAPKSDNNEDTRP